MKQYILYIAVELMSSNVFAQISETPVAVDTGTCGAACTWTFYDNGLLDISGSSAMKNWDAGASTDYITEAPWGKYYEDVTKINVGQGITTIGDAAFSKLINVTEVSLPNSIETLGYKAFSNTYALRNIEIPTSVTTIGGGAFLEAGIENIVVPDSVANIEFAAFSSPYLKTLVLPANLQSVSDNLLRLPESPGWDISNNLLELYCGDGAKEDCQEALNVLAEKTDNLLHPIIYSKDTAGNYYMYDDKGNMVGKYASLDALKGKSPSETYKYDSAGHLVGIFDGNGQRTWGKKIYTVEEAMAVTKNGDKFHVYLTYK